ncbi:hypothetical protein IGI04_006983 [Brassica rapa subsp. trilocularis]|uniref:Uncharacterized protein n=1 Tax=Brassica rapa subsp. trilocularis TaxID=1813537 RepID=A0ABQ7NII0_BRACM|nr:hypothetical protein IGI04_006983 [Brassica rapa subsp. trilocularis]
MDEHSYICLPEHARSFTQTKLVPEIYTKDEINEIFMESVEPKKRMKRKSKHSVRPKQLHQHRSKESSQYRSTTNPPHSNPMKSQPDSYTRAEIDQLVEEIYKTLESTEERLDRRCDDIYFPLDLTMSSSTSQMEAIQREHNNISTDESTPATRGRLVPKIKSDMSDTNNHGEKISNDAYATLIRNLFQLESLRERLQKIENASATMKDKWRRGVDAMRDFTGTWLYERLDRFVSSDLTVKEQQYKTGKHRLKFSLLDYPPRF